MLLLFILVAGFIKAVLLYRGLHLLSAAEIKRRARNRDHEASVIYKLASSQQGLDLLLVLIGMVCAMALIIIAANNSGLYGILTIIVITLAATWRPSKAEGSLLWKYVLFVAPYVYRLTKSITPPLTQLAHALPIRFSPTESLSIYETEDLLSIIDNQSKNTQNRIPEEDLLMAANALTFGDKRIADVMVPRRKIRFVSEVENVGPMLMDELHKTGSTVFPVIKSSSKPTDPEVIGMLSLNDLIANPDKGKVKDIMQNGKHYIDESNDLREALDEFIKTKSNLLIVTDNFQEVVGVINIDQVLEQIVGKKLALEAK